MQGNSEGLLCVLSWDQLVKSRYQYRRTHQIHWNPNLCHYACMAQKVLYKLYIPPSFSYAGINNCDRWGSRVRTDPEDARISGSCEVLNEKVLPLKLQTTSIAYPGVERIWWSRSQDTTVWYGHPDPTVFQQPNRPWQRGKYIQCEGKSNFKKMLVLVCSK